MRAEAIGCALVGLLLLAPGATGAKAPPAEGVVNINEATPEQLRLLPGIGAAMAKRIVAYRVKRRFRRPREIVRVRGIGRRTYRRLRPYLAVTGPTTLRRKVKQ